MAQEIQPSLPPPASRSTRRVARAAVILAGAAAIFVAGAAGGIYSYYRRTLPFRELRQFAIRRGWMRHWKVREAVSPSPQFEAVRNLPYVSGSFDPHGQARGVLVWDRARSQPGLNFFSSNGGFRAFLIDEAGKIQRQWSVRQEFSERFRQAHPHDGWVLAPDGGAFVQIGEYGIVRIDRDSRVLWTYRARTHHDLFVDGAGRIYALCHDTVPAPEISRRHGVVLDRIVVLSPGGKLEREIPLLDVLRRSPFRGLIPRLQGLVPRNAAEDGINLLHANHVDVFDGRLAGLSPLYAAGNILVSMRNINSIAILDGKTADILWLWGPSNLTYQHDPTLLPNGDILVFNNGRRASEVLEMDPRTDEVVWRYSRGRTFFSATLGGAQRLANGDTLITESNRGYAFEVTPSGETVWRFANPEVEAGGLRRGIWRMVRYDRSQLSFLRDRMPAPGSGGAD